jgi:predicted membrane protein
MRDSVGNKIVGAIFLIIGIIVGLNALDIVNVSLFFAGWWTLFIIVPSVVSMIKNGVKVSNFIWLLVGVLLFLSSQEIVDWYIIQKLILPIILVGIGMSIIFKDNFSKKIVKELGKNGLPEYAAVFSGQETNISGEKFTGADINSVFGGYELNLKNAVIDEDVVINATSVFGGIDILVPTNVNVKVSSTPIFGGTSNKVQNQKGENIPTIYVNSVCIFGGVDIK